MQSDIDESRGELEIHIEDRWGSWQIFAIGLLLSVFILAAMAPQLLPLAVPGLTQDWHISADDLALAMSMGWVGAAIGTILGGILGDRLGRRWTVIGALAVAALGTFAMTQTFSSDQLSIARLIQGIGLGAIYPASVTLITELVSSKKKGIIVGFAMVCGPLGISLASLLSAMPLFGAWLDLFWAMSIVLSALVLALVVFLPESPSFLVRFPKRRAELDRLLEKMNFSLKETCPVHAGPRQKRLMLTAVFYDGYRAQTLLISASFMLVFGIISTALSWLPMLLTSQGYVPTVAGTSLPAWSIGGMVGALLAGWATGRIGIGRTGTLFAGFAAVLLAFLGLRGFNPDWNIILAFAPLFGAGLMLSGCLTTLFAYTTDLYPADIRATGLGVAETAGRLGAVGGSYIGAHVILVAGSMGFFGILTAMALLLLLTYGWAERMRIRTKRLQGLAGGGDDISLLRRQ